MGRCLIVERGNIPLPSSIAHTKHPEWYLAWCSGFDIVGGDIAVCLIAELARGLACTANFKDESIINDEIALIMVMDLMAMGELRDKERLANRANIWSGAKGMEQIRIVQKQFVRLIDGTHSRPAPHTMNKPPGLHELQVF